MSSPEIRTRIGRNAIGRAHKATVVVTIAVIVAALIPPVARLDAAATLRDDATANAHQAPNAAPAAFAGGLSSYDDRIESTTDPFRIGVTHTQYSADSYNAPAAVTRADTILRTTVQLQNQHIMGFGALNPEPAHGVFDWTTLDGRVNLIRSTGGTPVLTLCCSPDWMKGGASGSTDWSKLEVAPSRDHYADYADLAAAVARRYPDITHYIVWNEMKGFWDVSRNRWNIEAYTELYNAVYAALKKVSPNIRVGGPYLPMDSYSSWRILGVKAELSGDWGAVDQRLLENMRYWLTHCSGADFIVVDGMNATKDKYLTTDDHLSNAKFVAITKWLRQQTTAPIWWAELYPCVNDQKEASSSQRRAAVAIDAIARIANAGASAVLLWQPQAGGQVQTVALWTDTRSPDGGVALPVVTGLQWLRSAATHHRGTIVSWRRDGLVAWDGSSTLVMPTAGIPVTVTCRGARRTIAGPQVIAGTCS